MNNSLFTQIFTRLKPTKYLTNLARLKNSASLSALILATLLLAACGGGGGGGSSSAASPATKVANFNLVPNAEGMTLSWTNPDRDDIAFINLFWVAFDKDNIANRTEAGDGYLLIGNSTQTAAKVFNEHNITPQDPMIPQSDRFTPPQGFNLGVGSPLNNNNAYIFFVRLWFNNSDGISFGEFQLTDIPFPLVPRELGANPDGDSFADTQVYSVGNPLSTSDGGNVTLSWTNPRVGAGNITSVTLSYQSNRSSNNRDEITLTAATASAQLLGDGSVVSYIWEDLEPGLYDFTIQPIFGGIFTGIEVVPGMTGTEVLRPADPGQLDPLATINPASAITNVFPDDGAISYNLTITQQDDIADPKLSVRPTITGTCSITPDGLRTLTYNASNQFSDIYEISYTGTAKSPEGDLLGGTCVINFQVVEDRRSVTRSRSITFNSELPPFLRADVIGDQTAQIKVPAQLNVTLVINATKLDAGNTLDVTFPREVTSSGGCVATLASGGSPILQYASINGMPATANSTAAATYNVSSPSVDIVSVTNCGTFAFAVTEGSATANSNLAGGISFDEATNKNLAPRVTTNPVGAITNAYPDDGAVSYTLNITKRDILAGPILNTTASITDGTCSIDPTGVTSLDYDAENNASTDYTITFTGTTTVGGSCDVEFVVTEDGLSETITRSITFNPELAPTLDAVLLGNATGVHENVPADEDVRVNVTATKQDGGRNPSITFPTEIISSSMPSCTAILAGSTTRQYNGVIAGTSSVSVTYNVRPTILGAIDNCGTFIFNATEGPATGMSSPFSGPISFVISDFDGDGLLGDADNCPMIDNPDQSDLDGDDEGDVCDDTDNDNVNDAFDLDYDGDGLIEIYNATRLDMMRNNLLGTGLDTDNSDGADRRGGDDTGCGGSRSGDADSCNGYELMADIDLNTLNANLSQSNWERVGSCVLSDDSFDCPTSNAFTGNFDGNGHNISNLRLIISEHLAGVGFFGSVANADLRNIIMTNASVSSSNIVGTKSSGGLVGNAVNTKITRVAVESGNFNFLSTGGLGILIGRGDNVIIASAAVIGNNIAGSIELGGLMGNCSNNCVVESSIVVVNRISGGLSLGGLVGQATSSTSVFSAAITNEIIVSNAAVGGLMGGNGARNIKSSYVISNKLSANSIIGPIVSISSPVENSYHNVGSIQGVSQNARGTALNITQLQPTAFMADGNGGNFTAWADGWCDTTTGEFTQNRTSDLATGVNANGVPAWDLVPDGPTRGDNSFPAPACTPFSPATIRTAIGKVRNAENPVPIDR